MQSHSQEENVASLLSELESVEPASFSLGTPELAEPVGLTLRSG
jgi:hypothetical protein